MEERIVTTRSGGPSVGVLSLLAVVIIAALVGLFVWQPWNGTTVQRTDTTTTQQTTSGTTAAGTSGSATNGTAANGTAANH